MGHTSCDMFVDNFQGIGIVACVIVKGGRGEGGCEEEKKGRRKGG